LRQLAMQPLSHGHDLLLVARYQRSMARRSRDLLLIAAELRSRTTTLFDLCSRVFLPAFTGRGPGVAVKIALPGTTGAVGRM
jgi:hypothetical protein